MRKSLAALGVVTLLGAAACLSVAQQVQSRISAPAQPPSTQPSSSNAATPRLLMDDRFVHGWPDAAQTAATVANGGYHLSARIPGQFVALRAPLVNVPGDVVVSASFRKVGGPPGGGYGLILRDQRTSGGDGTDQGGQYVVAEVGDRGELGVWRRDGDHWTDIVPWTPSTAIHADAAENKLTAQLVGNRLTFVANGRQVADVAVGLATGGVGIFVGGDRNEVLVEQFRVQTVEGPANLTAASSQPSVAQPRPAAPVAERAPTDRPRESPVTDREQRLRALLTTLYEDVSSFLGWLPDGFDGPHSPVNDPATLKRAVGQLDQATNSAREVVAEVERIRNGASANGP